MSGLSAGRRRFVRSTADAQNDSGPEIENHGETKPMATVRKVGNRQLKVVCDCKRKHLITADDEGELELETFGITGDDKPPKDDGKPQVKKDKSIFDLFGGE
jgi:hypothetical protein